MAQCKETITYRSGLTAHCSLSEHTHIIHEWMLDDPTPAPTPSLPAEDIHTDEAADNLKDLFKDLFDKI